MILDGYHVSKYPPFLNIRRSIFRINAKETKYTTITTAKKITPERRVSPSAGLSQKVFIKEITAIDKKKGGSIARRRKKV